MTRALHRLARILPFVRWFPVSTATLRSDLFAGITVGLVLVPQSMAYAQLAGLPPYYGLYAAFLPVLIGALFGSSNQLATGPVAMVSILTAAALAQIAAPGSDHFIGLAITLACVVGIMQLALGLFRLGSIVSFLSHPVIVGFTNAAAIIIALSQINKLLGIAAGRSDHFLRDVLGVIEQIPDTHLPTALMGIGAMALIFLVRRVSPRLPAVLIAVVACTFVSWWIGFERHMQATIEELGDADARTLAIEHHDGDQRLRKAQGAIETLLAEAKALRSDPQHSRPHLLTIEYQIQVLRLETRSLDNENRLRARALRRFRLELSISEDGTRRFYTAGGTPVGAKIEPGVWRIQRLHDQRLSLAGGGEVVGHIPPGLPSVRVPTLNLETLSVLLSAALVITLVGFMEAISIAKAMATKTRQRIDPNQELIGQGLANLAGSFTQCYPVSGSFSRSAVNLAAGAVTGMASVFTVLVVLVTLLFLTPTLYHLPQAVLAAIIMMAVVGLINFGAIKHAWQAHRHDGICAIVTFVATLAFAPHLDVGILVGGGLAIVMFLYRTMSPRLNVRVHDGGGTAAAVVSIHFDGRLYFANVPYFEDAVLEAASSHPGARAILVDGRAINEIDASGEEMLRNLHQRLLENDTRMVFAELKPQVIGVMRATGLYDLIGDAAFFPSEEDALGKLLQPGDKG
jgi:SulP family sulfate permease